VTSITLIATFLVIKDWHEACTDYEQDVECYNLLDYSPVALLLACRIFIVSLKYGMFSDEHMEILGKLYLTDEILDS
jgi:hypothetical protein